MGFKREKIFINSTLVEYGMDESPLQGAYSSFIWCRHFCELFQLFYIYFVSNLKIVTPYNATKGGRWQDISTIYKWDITQVGYRTSLLYSHSTFHCKFRIFLVLLKLLVWVLWVILICLINMSTGLKYLSSGWSRIAEKQLQSQTNQKQPHH